jgi:hypothetical protein
MNARSWRTRLGWGIEVAGLALLVQHAWRIG